MCNGLYRGVGQICKLRIVLGLGLEFSFNWVYHGPGQICTLHTVLGLGLEFRMNWVCRPVLDVGSGFSASRVYCFGFRFRV